MLEVSAPKPGNVHRGADFEDVTFTDFATSAVVLGEIIQSTAAQTMGATVLQAVRATRAVVGTNTNLGMILLLVPLAKIAQQMPGSRITIQTVGSYLRSLSPEDTADVFTAIRETQPGGLGDSEQWDVNDEWNQPIELIAAMRIAADRDSVARQFATDYAEVIEPIVASIELGRKKTGSLMRGIVYAHVSLMARVPDSLIARKCGAETAQRAQWMAGKALEQFGTETTDIGSSSGDQDPFWQSVGELDFWLRSDGHRRNPGTTADLIAASLFVGIYNSTIKAPYR